MCESKLLIIKVEKSVWRDLFTEPEKGLDMRISTAYFRGEKW